MQTNGDMNPIQMGQNEEGAESGQTRKFDIHADETIVITHYVNPEMFCFTTLKQVETNGAEVNQMELELPEHCHAQNQRENYALNQHVIVGYKSIEVTKLLRGVVVDFKFDECLVFALDYGFTLSCRPKELWLLPESLCGKYIGMGWGGLAGVAPFSASGWSQMAVRILDDVLREARHVVFKRQYQNQQQHHFGKLLIKTPRQYEPLLDAASYLVENQCAIFDETVHGVIPENGYKAAFQFNLAELNDSHIMPSVRATSIFELMKSQSKPNVEDIAPYPFRRNAHNTNNDVSTHVEQVSNSYIEEDQKAFSYQKNKYHKFKAVCRSLTPPSEQQFKLAKLLEGQPELKIPNSAKLLSKVNRRDASSVVTALNSKLVSKSCTKSSSSSNSSRNSNSFSDSCQSQEVHAKKRSILDLYRQPEVKKSLNTKPIQIKKSSNSLQENSKKNESVSLNNLPLQEKSLGNLQDHSNLASESAFTEHDLSHILAHSSVPMCELPVLPSTCSIEMLFPQSVENAMRKMIIERPHSTQRYAWPHLMSGSSLALIDSIGMGRSWCYLPTLCSLVINKMRTNVSNTGPLAVLIADSVDNANTLSNQCINMMESYDSHMTKVVNTHAQSMNYVLCMLLNSCGILVTTLSHLKQLLQCKKNLMNSKQWMYCVFDDYDRMLCTMPDLLNDVVEVLHALPKLQFVLVAQQWHSEFVELVKRSHRNPLLLFGDFLEAAIYGNLKLHVVVMRSNKKTQQLLDYLAVKMDFRKRTIIYCKNEAELAAVQNVLTCADYECIGLGEAANQQIHQLLLLTDALQQTQLPLRNFELMVHYSLPESWSKFKYRFHVFSDNIINCLDPWQFSQSILSYVMLDESDSSQALRLERFLDTHNIKLDEHTREMVQGLQKFCSDEGGQEDFKLAKEQDIQEQEMVNKETSTCAEKTTKNDQKETTKTAKEGRLYQLFGSVKRYILNREESIPVNDASMQSVENLVKEFKTLRTADNYEQAKDLFETTTAEAVPIKALKELTTNINPKLDNMLLNDLKTIDNKSLKGLQKKGNLLNKKQEIPKPKDKYFEKLERIQKETSELTLSDENKPLITAQECENTQVQSHTNLQAAQKEENPVKERKKHVAYKPQHNYYKTSSLSVKSAKKLMFHLPQIEEEPQQQSLTNFQPENQILDMTEEQLQQRQKKQLAVQSSPKTISREEREHIFKESLSLNLKNFSLQEKPERKPQDHSHLVKKYSGTPSQSVASPSASTSRMEHKLLVHSNLPVLPLSCSIDAFFCQEINNAMRNMHMGSPQGTQRYAWPHLMTGNSLVLIDSVGSGRSWCYLPTLCSLVMLCMRTPTGPEQFGPLALLLADSVDNVHTLTRKCINLMESYDTAKIKVVNTHALSLNDVHRKLLNSCGILVTTLTHLKQLIQFGLKLFDPERLIYCVLDDYDRMHCTMRDLLKEVLKLVQNITLPKLQFVLVAQHWHSEFVELVTRSQGNPLLLFGNFLEAAIYGNLKLDVKVMRSNKKTQQLLDYLAVKMDLKKRTVIYCKDFAELVALQNALTCAGYECIGLDEAPIQQIHELLLLSDALQQVQLPLKNFELMVHFSLPESWLKFTNRFHAFSDNINNLLAPRHFNSDLVSCLMLDESDSSKLPRLAKFFEGHNIKMAEQMWKMVASCRQPQDQSHQFCPQLLSSGKCKTVLCNKRHFIISEDLSDPMRALWQPKTLVRCKLNEIYDPVHIAVLPVSYKSGDSNFESWQEAPNLSALRKQSMALNIHMSMKQNRRIQQKLNISDICIKKSGNGYQRVRVVDLSEKSLVMVQLMDDGTELLKVKATELLECDERFKVEPPLAMNVRLCGLMPNTENGNWHPNTIKWVSNVLNSLKDNQHLQLIVEFAMHNVVYVKDITVIQECPTLRICVKITQLQNELINKGFGKRDEQSIIKLRKIHEELVRAQQIQQQEIKITEDCIELDDEFLKEEIDKCAEQSKRNNEENELPKQKPTTKECKLFQLLGIVKKYILNREELMQERAAPQQSVGCLFDEVKTFETAANYEQDKKLLKTIIAETVPTEVLNEINPELHSAEILVNMLLQDLNSDEPKMKDASQKMLQDILHNNSLKNEIPQIPRTTLKEKINDFASAKPKVTADTLSRTLSCSVTAGYAVRPKVKWHQTLHHIELIFEQQQPEYELIHQDNVIIYQVNATTPPQRCIFNLLGEVKIVSEQQHGYHLHVKLAKLGLNMIWPTLLNSLDAQRNAHWLVFNTERSKSPMNNYGRRLWLESLGNSGRLQKKDDDEASNSSSDDSNQDTDDFL